MGTTSIQGIVVAFQYISSLIFISIYDFMCGLQGVPVAKCTIMSSFPTETGLLYY